MAALSAMRRAGVARKSFVDFSLSTLHRLTSSAVRLSPEAHALHGEWRSGVLGHQPRREESLSLATRSRSGRSAERRTGMAACGDAGAVGSRSPTLLRRSDCLIEPGPK